MEDKTLRFGYNNGLPLGTKAAWGARAIYAAGGEGPSRVDILADRQSSFGFEEFRSSDAMFDWLNAGALKFAREAAGRAYGWTDGARVLYRDDLGVIVGNPQRSYGYLYLCAYLRADVQPDKREAELEATAQAEGFVSWNARQAALESVSMVVVEAVS